MILRSHLRPRRNRYSGSTTKQSTRVLRSISARRALFEQLEHRVVLATLAAFDFSDNNGTASAEGFVSSGPANQWHLSTGRGTAIGHSSDDSFYFGSGEGPAGNGSYTNNADGTLLSPSIDLSGTTVARLSFKHFLNTEPGADLATVSVVHSGGTTVIASSGAEMPNLTVGFETVNLDLTAYVGQSIQLAFRFTSDASVTAEGWYVDDVIITTANTGRWQPQGPFGSTAGQVENNSPSNQVIGSIHVVLAHPTNPDIVYIGAANGGVWKTNNATALRPNWTPLTDHLPSQSIGAMAFDIADPTSNTIYAGVGRYSSFGQIGNTRAGLYKSTDGGQSWTILADRLAGANISGIVANGNNVVVSVNIADNFNFVNIGIFRSTDGGTTFTGISTGDGTSTGLPGGVSYDLVADPRNPNVLYTSAVFSDLVGGQNGVYKSSDGGASWFKVSSPAMDALIVSGGGGGPGTSNLELAAGKFNNVYAAIINNGDMKGLFRSDDNGLTWIQMDTPTTNENGIDVGLNPRGTKGPAPAANPSPEQLAGGQGNIHFSIVADPDDPNILYVAGDRQPRANGDTGGFPNSIGAVDFSGRLFRGDASQPAGSQFVHLTHSNTLGPSGGGTASGSSPHADSRDMTFDANGDLIEVDDGGIYRRTSPKDNTGDWFGMMGNLQVTEAHNVAYDSLSNTIMTGNQDTGSTFQSSTGAQTWVSLSTADGGDIAVDNVSLAASNQSVRYSSFQNLGAFRRSVYDASGNVVSQTFPALSGFNGDGAFVSPMVLNAVDPNRLAIQGGTQTYVTLDQGASVTGLGAAPNGSIIQNALAYGGRRSGVANPDVLWVGSGSDVFVRTSAAANLAPTLADPTNSTIRDLAIDPDDWASAFVIDNNSVFVTNDTGDTWTDITGNLLSLASTFFSTIYVATSTVDALLVGTNAGVFASLAGSFGNWTLLGAGLPNVLTYDLDHDAGDDVVVAGTLGRGAWRLENVSSLLRVSSGTTAATLDASNNLVLTDQDGNYPDNIRIQSDTVNNRFVITGEQQSIITSIAGATGNGTNTVLIPFAAVAGPDLVINTLGGNDSLTVDFGLGNFSKQIRYQGGTTASDRGNSLTLVGGTFDNAVYNFTGQGRGNVDLSNNALITYTQLEPIRSEIQTIDSVLNYNDAAGTLTVTPFGIGGSGINVGSATAESISVVTPTQRLSINGANAPNNNVLVTGPIDLGGTSLAITGNDIALDRASIVASATGSIAINATRALGLFSGSRLDTEDGDIALRANQSPTPVQGDFDGILQSGSIIATVNGDVLLEGRGGAELGGSFNRGILVTDGSQILSTGTGPDAGTISLVGRGGDGNDGNRGVQFSAVGTRISSVDGDISIAGTGGTSTGGFNQGVIFFEGVVESTGIGPDAARIDISGIGGIGTDSNAGVFMQGIDTRVTSIDGDISVVGLGKGTADFNAGVLIRDEAQIQSTGIGVDAAAINLSGTGANARQFNRGIQLVGVPAVISTVDGDLQMTGLGGNGSGGFNQGLSLFSGLISSTGLGDLNLQGTARGLSGEGVYLDGGVTVEATAAGDVNLSGSRMGFSDDVFVGFAGGATLGSPTGSGILTITADSLNVDNVSAIQGTGGLNFIPRTSSTSIGVGAGFGLLSLNSLELSRIIDGFSQITIGDELAGVGSVSVVGSVFTDPIRIVGGFVDLAGLDATDNAVVVIARAGFISDSSASTDVAGSTVTLVGNVSPGQTPGILTVKGDVVFNDDAFFGFEIGGVAPFITPNHDMMEITGSVTIGANVSLLTARLAGFAPSVGNRFVLINNDGLDPIDGTFVGLDEGDRIDNFLGSSFSATITYQGGTDNNDVVLTVLPSVTLTVDPAGIPENNGVATFTARLSAPLGVPVTVNLGFTGTAIVTNDYEISGTQIVIPAGQSTGSVTVTAVPDSLIETNETVTAEIVGVTNGFVTGIQQATTSILDDDFLKPIIDSLFTGATNAVLLPFTVNFNGDVTGFDQSDLQVSGGTISNFTDQGGGLYGFSVTPAGEGTVAVSVPANAAEDSAGKSTLASDLFNLIIDRTAPTPVMTAPTSLTNANPFDVNIAFGELVTDFDLTDIVVTGGTIEQLVDNGNGEFTATVRAAVDGNVSLDIAANVATDAAGNPSLAAIPFSIAVDTSIPVATISGPVSPSNIAPLLLTVEFGESVSDFTISDITVSNGTVTNLTDNGSGVFALTIEPASDGLVTVDIPAGAASDPAGNESLAAPQYAVTIDTLAPTPTITGPQAPSTVSAFDVTIDFAEPVNGFSGGDLALGNATLSNLIDNADGSYTATIVATSDGPVTVDISADAASDSAGNSSLAASRLTIVVDTTAPTLIVPDDLVAEGDSVGGAAASGTTLTAFLSAATATDTVDTSVSITNDAPAFFPLGTTLVTFTATDDAGYSTAATVSVTVVDTTAPALTVPNSISLEGDVSGGVLSSNASITAFLAAASATDLVDSSATVTHDAPSLFSVGDTIVTFTVEDDAGNVQSTGVVVTVTDTTAPTITVPADIELEGDTAGGASNNGSLLAAFLSAATGSDIVDAALTFTHDAPSVFPVGVTVVTFTVTDDSNNSASDTATVTVSDTQPPTFSLPANLSLEGDTAGGLSATGAAFSAFLAGVGVTDVVDSSPTVTHNAPALLPLGATTITFTATDGEGNSTSAVVSVTVVDSIAPTITQSGDITIEGDQPGGVSILNTAIAELLASATATDFVDTQPVVSHNAPANFPLGDTVVTFTAVDDSGNISSASATVTVTDTTAPVFSAVPDFTANANVSTGAEATVGALVDYFSSVVATDIVDPLPTITHDAPAVLPLGDTLVTFTATDAAGNTQTATATISVIAVDFGDAPSAADSGFANSYPTTLAQNGARHLTGTLVLGQTIDFDGDGQPDAQSDLDDDDGVFSIASLISAPNVATASSVRVIASEPARLDAWIDFNRDGDWDDAGEQIFTSVDVQAGSNLLSFAVPAGAAAGSTGARYRLSTTGALAPTGLALDGEVEDYLATILAASSSATAAIEIPDGSSDVVVESNQVVVRNDSTELFRTPLNSFGNLNFAGTTLDDVLRINVLSSFAGQSLTFDGGAGEDLLRLAGAGQTLDLSGPGATVRNVEEIDITGSGDNALVLSVDSVKDISTSTDTLAIAADAGDQITFGEGWRVSKPMFIQGRFTHLVTESATGGTARIELRNDRMLRNPLNRFDADRDGSTLPLDALRIINELRRRGNTPITLPTNDSEIGNLYFDVSGDNNLSGIDALQVINALSRMNRGQSVSGEAEPVLVDLDEISSATANVRDNAIRDATASLIAEPIRMRSGFPGNRADTAAAVSTEAIDDFMRRFADNASADATASELELLSDAAG
ncbi:MAG: Ig-like domain-containing protein [Planctomycetaceae bacterium]